MHFIARLRQPAEQLQDAIDTGMAVGLAAIVFGIAIAMPARLDPLGAALLLAQTLPIAVRRRHPPLVLVVTGVSIALYAGLGYEEVGGNLGVLIAFYTVAAHVSRKWVAFAAVMCGMGVFFTVAHYSLSRPFSSQEVAQIYVEYLIAWVVGDFVRVRRLYIRELEERNVRLEREREERARLAVMRERTRIARELHDVVAHHVSVMVVQSAAGRRVVDRDATAAREAFEAVEDAGRTALAEMRRMLEVLRAQEPDREPQPGLAELDALVERVEATGLPVELRVEDSRDIPAGIHLAAYRVIQEALTNTVKHAGLRARASVRVRFEPDCLDIEVVDDGRGAAAGILEGGPTTGHTGQGLIGMRERVALYGGELEVGPRLSGGFRVHARFPLPPLARTVAPAPGASSGFSRPVAPVSAGPVFSPWPEDARP